MIPTTAPAAVLLGLILFFLHNPLVAEAWKVYNIEDFGAKPGADATDALRAALAAAGSDAGGAEVLVPRGGAYLTAPINVTSHVLLRVDGTLAGVRDQDRYPVVDVLPSYGVDMDLRGDHRRFHPLVWSVGATNVTICGTGTIDGAGSYWLDQWHNRSLRAGRPHLMEIMHGKDVTVAGGLTLLDAGFWTLHPVYCTNFHVHGISILASHCETWDDACNPNIDGIDVDSSQNVLIENNHISVGDDHVTVLAGRGEAGRAYGVPSRNVTVRNNLLGTGMGLSIGSSVSGGVEDVLYYNNTMRETREQWGQGVHIKTAIGIGGYIRNITWDSNVYYSTGTEAIIIEADYQSSGMCGPENCTRIDGIVLRNLTFHNSSRPGRIVCSDVQPCSNITLENVHINGFDTKKWGQCQGVVSSTFANVQPAGLDELCGMANPATPAGPHQDGDPGKRNVAVYIVSIIVAVIVLGGLIYHRGTVKRAFSRIRRRYWDPQSSRASGGEPLLDKTIIFETSDTGTLMV